MSATLGNKATFTWNGTDITAKGNDFQIPMTQPALNSSVFGATWENKTPGLPSYTVSFAGFYDSAVGAAIFPSMAATASQAWSGGFFGTTPGNEKYSGNAVLSKLTPNGKVGALVAFTSTFEGDGALTRGTY